MNPIPLLTFPGILDLKVIVSNVVSVGGPGNGVIPQTGELANDICVFAQNDPYGLMMAMLGMGIVFSALFLLYVVFTNTPRLYTVEFREKLKTLFSRKKPIVVSLDNVPRPEDAQVSDLTGEVNAAIAAAIYLYRSELHDHENTVLTIKKVARTYSPWSSKIYGLRNLHR